MMTHEPAWEPIRGQRLKELKKPEQPMLPFGETFGETAFSASTNGEPTEAEIEPREVWEALPAATKAEVRRGCLRAVRRVIGDAPE